MAHAVTETAASAPLPRHIAITMDGNGRWAAARGLARTAGHKAGLEPVRLCVRECARLQIEALTLFAFSIACTTLFSHGEITSVRPSSTAMLATCCSGTSEP